MMILIMMMIQIFLNINMIYEDMNLKMNFSELEEINIGNISNEKQFYKKFINSNNSKIKFNIISLDELKKSKKNNVNIIYKEKYNEDEENYEDEDEENVDYEYEENNLINDKYEDDGDVVVNDIKIKTKKFKKEKEIEEDVVCCVREYLDHYNSYRLIDEKTIKNMLRLNSKIITTKRGYNDLYMALGKMFPSSSLKIIKSKLLFDSSRIFIIPKGLNNMNNLLFIFNTNKYDYICAFIKKGGLKSLSCFNNFLLARKNPSHYYDSELIYFLNKKEIDKGKDHMTSYEKYMLKNNNYTTIDNFKDLFEHLSFFNSQFLEEKYGIVDINKKEQLIEYEIFQLFFN